MPEETLLFRQWILSASDSSVDSETKHSKSFQGAALGSQTPEKKHFFFFFSVQTVTGLGRFVHRCPRAVVYRQRWNIPITGFQLEGCESISTFLVFTQQDEFGRVERRLGHGRTELPYPHLTARVSKGILGGHNKAQ